MNDTFYGCALTVGFVCGLYRLTRYLLTAVLRFPSLLSLVEKFAFKKQSVNGSKDQDALPGPMGLPYFGYMFSLGSLPHEHLASLVQRYSDLFRVKAGCRKFVVVSSIDRMNDIARRFPEQLCGKPRTFTTEQLSVGAHNDMIKRWKRRRAHMNAGLKYIERYSVSSIINSEVSHIVEFLSGNSAKQTAARDVSHDISFFVARIIYRVSYGSEPDMEAQQCLKDIVHSLPDYTTTIGSFSPFDLVPFLRYVHPERFRKFVDFNRYLSKFCRNEKAKSLSRKESAEFLDTDSKSPPADLFEHFTRKWEQMSESDKEKFNLTEDLLYDTLEDIIRAGTESSSLLIQWFMLFMAAFPHVQRHMQAELDKYIREKGKTVIDDNDLFQLPYCQACLTETYRYTCLNPFLKRELTDSVQYDGYTLRRGTVLLYNQWAINNDERYFPNPRLFQPERFLDSQGRYDETLTQKFAPFGFGKRKCIGVYTGRMICSLACVAIVQNFTVNLESTVDLEPISGIGLTPKKHLYLIKARLT